jgi:hypothetical protein
MTGVPKLQPWWDDFEVVHVPSPKHLTHALTSIVLLLLDISLLYLPAAICNGRALASGSPVWAARACDMAEPTQYQRCMVVQCLTLSTNI